MTLPQPTPAMAAVFPLLALHLCAVLTGLGAFAFAWLCEFLAGVGRQGFLKKLAQQMSALGVLFTFYILVATGGAMAVMAVQFPEFVQPWLDAPLLMAVPGAAIGWLLLTGLLYVSTWRGSKNRPGLHRSLGFLAALGLPLVLAGSLAVKFTTLAGGPLPTDASMLQTALAAGMLSPYFWPLLTVSFFQALTCAAGFGLAWLLVRRRRDDFGRDYYAFALPQAAQWAVVFAALAAAAQAWTWHAMPQAATEGPGAQLLIWLGYAGFGALLLAAALWLAVRLSKAPLRMKPAVWLAALALVAAMGIFTALNTAAFFPLL